MLTLYHGTTDDAATSLSEFGWRPGSGRAGANCGQSRYLYLTNGQDNALWFAEQKGGSVVLAVEVDEDDLLVDPEDGSKDDVASELAWGHGLPGSVVATRPLPADRFSRLDAPTPGP